MIYFKNESGEVFAYESEDERINYGADDLVLMTEEEVAAHLTPVPVVAQVPRVVTMRQARLAMLWAGILYDVEAMIAGMEGDEGKAAQIDWEFAQDVRRDWPLVAALGSQLGMSEEQIDELFVAAAAIPQ